MLMVPVWPRTVKRGRSNNHSYTRGGGHNATLNNVQTTNSRGGGRGGRFAPACGTGYGYGRGASRGYNSNPAPNKPRNKAQPVFNQAPKPYVTDGLLKGSSRDVRELIVVAVDVSVTVMWQKHF